MVNVVYPDGKCIESPVNNVACKTGFTRKQSKVRINTFFQELAYREEVINPKWANKNIGIWYVSCRSVSPSSN